MYIISSSSRRREFETLKEALAVKTEGDDLYESDAFGNCTPLSPDRINELTAQEKSEPQEKTEVKENTAEPTQEIPEKGGAPTAQEKIAEPVKPKKKWMIYLKYTLYAGIIIVTLYLLMTAAIPALDGLMHIYNNVLG